MPTSPRPRPSSSCGCVILAAGGSKRLGRPKQLVEFKGVSLLERTLQAALATPGIWPVVVVIGAQADQIRPLLRRHPVLIAENPAWAEGVASSLRAGLNTLDQFSAQLGRAIVTLCDQPHLSAQSLSALLAAGADAPDALVAARYEGHPGAPALFGRDHFSALSQLTGDEGARTLFRSVPAAKITMVDLPQLSVDLDTPEDFHRITGQPIFD